MRRSIILLAALCAALTTWACQELSPEEKVSRARARYTVKLNGFFVREEPAAEVVAADEEAVAGEEATEETAAEGGEEAAVAVETGPQPVDVLLDLIVQHDLDDALPGVTVDITMVDPERNEKGSWRVFIETAGLPKANQKQVTHVLEDIDYQEGDGFSVELRSNIPPAEYGDYREFAAP